MSGPRGAAIQQIRWLGAFLGIDAMVGRENWGTTGAEGSCPERFIGPRGIKPTRNSVL